MNAPIEKKIDGRSKEARAARALEQSASAPVGDREDTPRRQPSGAAARLGIREEQRAEPRRPMRDNIVRGRDGEILSRKRSQGGDPFDVISDDPNFEFQWIAVSVLGNTEVVMDQNLGMLENGWRPVPASRFPGRYMPAGYSGHIVRGGQGLYERPKVLCQEARDEDVKIARQLISDRNESLKLSGVKNGLPSGFEMNQRYRGTGGDLRMSIDRALDVPTPSYDLAEPGE